VRLALDLDTLESFSIVLIDSFFLFFSHHLVHVSQESVFQQASDSATGKVALENLILISKSQVVNARD
jgi:hypothetical protein